HLNGLAGHLQRRQLWRRNQVAQILPHHLVRRLPLHRHPRGNGFGGWLEPLPEIFANAAAVLFQREDVSAHVFGNLYGTLHQEVPEVGNKSARQWFLRTTESRRGLTLRQNHLGGRCAWITPLWRNRTQR